MQKTVQRNDYTIYVGQENKNDDIAEQLADKYGVASPKKTPEKNQFEDVDFERILLQRDQLVKKLEEKNRKIESLCVMLEAAEKADKSGSMESVKKVMHADDGTVVDPRDSKIVQLAKKSHNLQMLLNKVVL